MTEIWISAAGLCIATLIGAVLGFLFKGTTNEVSSESNDNLDSDLQGGVRPTGQLPHKWNDTILGYCAGIMLAASTLGLIVPAFEMTSNWWWVAIGVMVGALFLNVLDLVTPHLHHITGLDPEEHSHNSTLNHVLLFVMAIALHKLPEGMAAGVSMSTSTLLSTSSATETSTDWTVSFGIALQNIPEGMVIIAPLLLAGVSKMRTLIISLAIGFLEIAGVWLGFGLGSASATLLPIMLGFAGGAMLYVTSDEMIPETHAHGYQKQATYALLLGFMTLLLMEKAFE